jgi:hypothetical protein
MGERSIEASRRAPDPDSVDGTEHELRAKAVVRRGPVTWTDHQGVWEATIGRWKAQVGPCLAAPGRWEWRAYSSGIAPRAVGGRGWAALDQAQKDAESTLAAML